MMDDAVGAVVNVEPEPAGDVGENGISKKIGIAPFSTFTFKGVENDMKDQRIPMQFKLVPNEDYIPEGHKSLLYLYICAAGGKVIPEGEKDTHAIRILNEVHYRVNSQENIQVPPDTYSSVFVYRCILNMKKGTPPPESSKYLVSSSLYETYDAMEILKRKKTWRNLTRLPDNAPSKIRTVQQWFAKVDRAILKSRLRSESASLATALQEIPGNSQSISDVLQRGSRVEVEAREDVVNNVNDSLSDEISTSSPTFSQATPPRPTIRVSSKRTTAVEDAKRGRPRKLHGGNHNEVNDGNGPSNVLGRSPSVVPFVGPSNLKGISKNCDQSPVKQVECSDVEAYGYSEIPITEQATNNHSYQEAGAAPDSCDPSNSPKTSRYHATRSQKIHKSKSAASQHQIPEKSESYSDDEGRQVLDDSDDDISTSPPILRMPTETKLNPNTPLKDKNKKSSRQEKSPTPKFTTPSRATAKVNKECQVTLRRIDEVTDGAINERNGARNDLGSSPLVKIRATTSDVSPRVLLGRHDVISGNNKRKNSATNGSPSAASKYPRLVPIPVAGPSSKPNKFFKTRQNSAKKNDDGWVDVGSHAHSSSSDTEILDKEMGRKDDSDNDSFNSDVTYHSDSSDTSKRTSKRKPHWLRYYSKEDGQKILDVICKNELFLYTGGNILWNTLEKAKFLKERTGQSMKNHYLKTVLGKVLSGKVYTISTEDVKRLKKAQTDALKNKHANLCPDFDPTNF